MTSDQRKVLEDIRRTKRLLKEGAAISLGTLSSFGFERASAPTPPASSGSGETKMSPGMKSAMQVLSIANTTSFGFFVPQDSHFGNSILPVLPRIEPPNGSQGQVPATCTSASPIKFRTTTN